MSFSLRPFTPPDFTQEKFRNAPNATLVPCPKDGVAPEAYHAMSIFPEYFKVDGQWIMATSRWVTKVYKPSNPLPRTGY